jgi:peptidoglycan/xylan/chitin deacetylase (PgdA/CDA1 family)
MNSRYITVSVDDGYPADSRAADLLNKYGLQATFYIPARNPEHPVMAAGQIRELSRGFEIGGHTYNHAALKSLSTENAWEEIYDGKRWLEDLLGEPVVSFCYPQGKFNRKTPVLVKQAGFLGGRTCLFNLHTFPRDPFLWGLSTHACGHSKFIQTRHALLERNFAGVRNFFLDYKGATDWPTHFFRGLDYVEKHGGIAHLYFHSWEIEDLGDWERLESALQAATQRHFTSVTNGALFRLWGESVTKRKTSPETADEFAVRSQ